MDTDNRIILQARFTATVPMKSLHGKFEREMAEVACYTLGYTAPAVIHIPASLVPEEAKVGDRLELRMEC